MEKQKFYPMQQHPEVAKDLKGNEENFSISVLVFDADGSGFCNIGFYNFDLQEWSHFGDESMKLICWCHLPDASQFIKENPDLKFELHTGYQP